MNNYFKQTMETICILSSLSNSNFEYKSEGRCHKIIYKEKDKNFFIIIGNLSIQCSRHYIEISINKFYGNLICPDFNRVYNGSV